MPESHSTVWLQDANSGQLRPAVLCEGIQERHLVDVEQLWKPALGLVLKWAGRHHLEESSHWDWRAKLRSIGRSRRRSSFVVECDNMTQGLMIVDVSRKARLEPDCGRGLVYVDYVEVAPWNRREWQPKRVFHSIGSAFLGVAIDWSFQLGFEGRIGLHSLPKAESFYRKVGMSDLGSDSNYEDLRYFEMTARVAQTSNLRDYL